MARSIASIASLPENPGTKAFHELISPLRDWRVEKERCTARFTAWKIVSAGKPSSAPMPAVVAGARWATWSFLNWCSEIAFTSATWIS